jgi:multiple sugar transport system ATP-binding protein
MNRGCIEQVGTPNELYHAPKTRFVAGFIGSPAMNFIPCRLEAIPDGLGIRVADGFVFPLPRRQAERYRPHVHADRLLLGLRPEHVTEARAHLEPGAVPFEATLEVTEPMGMETLVYFTMNGTQVCGRVNPNAGARDGTPFRLAADLNHVHLIDEATGRVI